MTIAIASPMTSIALVHGLSDAVLTTARTPSAASASVMIRWMRPNLIARPRGRTRRTTRLVRAEPDSEGGGRRPASDPRETRLRPSSGRRPGRPLDVGHGTGGEVPDTAFECRVPL